MERNINKLRKWCVRKRLQGWPVTGICSHARVPRRTFYNWWYAFQDSGFGGLGPKSRKPEVVHKTSENIVQRIVEIRQGTGWNEKAIQAKLETEGIEVGHNTVYRVMKKAGLIAPLKEPRKQKTFCRWSREHPNSLWQTDLSIYGKQWLATFLDDCSRFIVGIALFDHGTTENILDLFQTAISEHGKPREVLTDHGTQYYATKGQVSGFTRFCEGQGIKHILGGIGKPTTTGKIERFHRTFKEQYTRFNNIQNFAQYYNFERPHSSLNYVPPAQVYLK